MQKLMSLALALALSMSAVASVDAATDTKPAATSDSPKSSDKGGSETKFTKAQIEAFLSKCSDEADAKGLSVKQGKGEARKEFRRECMRKFGVNPK